MFFRFSYSMFQAPVFANSVYVNATLAVNGSACIQSFANLGAALSVFDTSIMGSNLSMRGCTNLGSELSI